MGALRPQYNDMLTQAKDAAAATGLGSSGAGGQFFGNAEAQNAASLTNAVAPAYLQAMQDYAGIIGQMPGAQAQAYQQAINNLYTGVGDLGSMAAGLPPMGGSPAQAGAPNGYQSGNNYYTQSGDPYLP